MISLRAYQGRLWPDVGLISDLFGIPIAVQDKDALLENFRGAGFVAYGANMAPFFLKQLFKKMAEDGQEFEELNALYYVENGATREDIVVFRHSTDAVLMQLYANEEDLVQGLKNKPSVHML